MRTQKLSLILVIALTLAMIPAGCLSAATAPDEKIIIGFSVQNMTGLFPLYTAAGARHYMSQPEISERYELMLLNPDGRADLQLTQVESMIQAGVKAIVLNPVDRVGLVPAVEAAHRAGVHVITLNTTVDIDDPDLILAHIGLDDVKAGELQMEYAVELIGESGGVGVLHGTLGHSAQILRWEGYNNVANRYPNVTIVADQETRWTTANAQTVTENWLQAGAGIDVIVCNNDGIAMGAANAIEASGMVGEIFVVGIDALEAALIMIQEGKLTVTFDQDAPLQGELGVRLAIDAIEGRPVSDISLELITIDSSNIDEFMELAAYREELNRRYNN